MYEAQKLFSLFLSSLNLILGNLVIIWLARTDLITKLIISSIQLGLLIIGSIINFLVWRKFIRKSEELSGQRNYGGDEFIKTLAPTLAYTSLILSQTMIIWKDELTIYYMDFFTIFISSLWVISMILYFILYHRRKPKSAYNLVPR